MRTLIKGGTIVNADAMTRADVLVDGEQIVQIGVDLDVPADRSSTPPASGSSRAGSTATRTWSCRSAAPSPRTRSRPARARRRSAARRRSSTSPSSRAAARSVPGLDTWHEKADGKACIDYGFHMIVSDMRDDLLPEMDRLVEEGVTDVQALHRLPGRVPERRRGDLQGPSADREERRPDPHARRERARHRRRRGRPRGRRHDRSDRSRSGPLPGLRGRGHQPRHPAGPGGRRARVLRPHVGEGRP